MAESFFATLEKDLVRLGRFRTRVSARVRLFEYVEMFYTGKRREPWLGSVSPVELERISEFDSTRVCEIDSTRGSRIWRHG